jgi:uncharacterized protein (TIGR03790 family)
MNGLAARLLLLFAWAAATLPGQTAANVLLVVNEASPLSHEIGRYYALRRHIPAANICRIHASLEEEISREEYDQQIAAPLAKFLEQGHLQEKILYLVTTSGVPLKIRGHGGLTGDAASVDSELTLLYADLHGRPHSLPGGIGNPFFGKAWQHFRHPDFPIYLVTRLAGYDFDDVRGIIDRALAARNRGKFVIDVQSGGDPAGDRWLREAAQAIPKDRVVLDDSPEVLYDLKDVIGYASWGSNDAHRKQRHLGFQWLPGAIMTEYVSTNARTFARPPDNWTLGMDFRGSSQSLTADYIHDGVTGASGHVYEPYLQLTPHPNILLPAYYSGRNLAESYYLAIPMLSWMNVVIGDPLCTLGPPR